MKEYLNDPDVSFISADIVDGYWRFRAHGPHLEEGVGFSDAEAVADLHYRKLIALIRKHFGSDARPACETDRLLRRRPAS